MYYVDVDLNQIQINKMAKMHYQAMLQSIQPLYYFILCAFKFIYEFAFIQG